VTLDATELGRLRWRCRRGMKELDRVLVYFVERLAAGEFAHWHAAFDELLGCEDSDLWHWLTAQRDAPRDDWNAIIATIRTDYRP
jgi:antitoxin CptB